MTCCAMKALKGCCVEVRCVIISILFPACLIRFTVCSEGYYLSRDYNSCVSCEGTALFTPAFLITLLIVIVLLTLVAIKIYKNIMSKKSINDKIDDNTTLEQEKMNEKSDELFHVWFQQRVDPFLSKMRILMTTFQIVMTCQSSFRISFPSSFNKFISVFSILNLNIIDVMPLSCMVEYDFVTSLILSTVAPLAFTGILLILFVSEFLYRRRKANADAVFGQDITHMPLKLQEIMKNLRLRYFSVFLFMTYWILPGTTTTIFATFVCVDVDPGDNFI